MYGNMWRFMLICVGVVVPTLQGVMSGLIVIVMKVKFSVLNSGLDSFVYFIFDTSE